MRHYCIGGPMDGQFIETDCPHYVALECERVAAVSRLHQAHDLSTVAHKRVVYERETFCAPKGREWHFFVPHGSGPAFVMDRLIAKYKP